MYLCVYFLMYYTTDMAVCPPNTTDICNCAVKMCIGTGQLRNNVRYEYVLRKLWTGW